MTDAPPLSPPSPRALTLLAVGALGATAVMTQLALMRELLAAFSGNELVLGICLGNWLLLTGLGAGLGRWLAPRDEGGTAAAPAPPATAERRPAKWLRGAPWFNAGLIVVAVIPLFQVAAVRVLRDPVFGHGMAVGLTGTVVGSLVLLAPFCLVSGALLVLACSAPAPTREHAGLGRVYLADTVGGIAGGVLFSFALVPWCDHFALLCFPAFLDLTLAGLLAWRRRAWFLLEVSVVVAAGLAVHVALVDADFVTTALQFRGEEVVFRANSPYGRLVVGDRDGLLTFHENGVPVAATENLGAVEEAVEYALSQRPAARRVLLLGGGVTGDAREILRADPGATVTYVELDPAIVAAGWRLLPENLDDPRIRIVTTDGRRFVRRSHEHFDAAIIDLPDPSTSQLNRFYTAEFFQSLRRRLAPGAVLAFGLGHYENYVSPELGRLLASARRTLATVFPHLLMIPGGRVFFLASDRPLDPDIASRLAQSGVPPRLLTRSYLQATLAPDRLADLDRAVARPAARNRDFDPILYYYHLRHWLSQFAGPSKLLAAGLGLLLAGYLLRLRPAPRIIFASGFAASGLEVVILLGYQVLYGSLYRQVGVVVTVFMAGLAAGAWWATHGSSRVTTGCRRRPGRTLVALACGVALLAAALPWLLRAPAVLEAATGGEAAGQGFILLLTFGLAWLVGAQFPLAGSADAAAVTAVAAGLFGADLVGAALGALLVSTLLLPLFGVTIVCLLTAGLNAAAAGLAWRRSAA